MNGCPFCNCTSYLDLKESGGGISLGVYYLKDKKMAQKILSIYRQKKSNDIEIEIVESDERD